MSFEIACRNGFVEMAQFLIGVGAKHGAVSAKELLPHATAISGNLNETDTAFRDM
jgi:hypothetical protein